MVDQIKVFPLGKNKWYIKRKFILEAFLQQQQIEMYHISTGEEQLRKADVYVTQHKRRYNQDPPNTFLVDEELVERILRGIKEQDSAWQMLKIEDIRDQTPRNLTLYQQVALLLESQNEIRDSTRYPRQVKQDSPLTWFSPC